AERVIADARAGRFPQRRARTLRVVANDVQRLRADAARGQIHHAFERRIVTTAGDEAQIRERIFDFRALEEPQTAVHTLRNARGDERFFERSRLRVRAIQHRDVAPRTAMVRPVAHALDEEVRFIALVEGGVELDGFALRAGGPEILAEAAGVVCDEG